MKRIGNLLIFILGSVGYTVGQTYHDFPLDETAQWQVNFGWLDGSGCLHEHEILCYLDGDTSLDGMTYIRISYFGYNWGVNAIGGAFCNTPPIYISGLRGLFRVDSGKYYMREYYSGPEMLIYDFTLDVGDTLDTALDDYPLVVDSIDFVPIDNESCKRMWLSYANGMGGELKHITEGIGSQNGLRASFYEFENWSNLECYSHDGLSVIGPLDPYPCLLINDVADPEELSVHIFPNPTNNILSVSGLPSPTSFSIHNLLGKQVMSGVHSSGKPLDVSLLTSGIYLIQLNLDGKSAVRKFVKQ